MSKIKISAVSYTNSKPFVYGMRQSNFFNSIELSLDIPSDCANKLIENQVDIGLVPVVALAQIKNYQIISNYCIGAIGRVDSVFIFSNKPILEIETLQLDAHSRTSNVLSQILLKYHWKINPNLVLSEPADAFVQIGDRTFLNKNKYPFQYDLAEQWFNFTGLPFVFAVWAANKSISERFKMDFNKALKYGLDHRKEVILSLDQVENLDLENYLMDKIDFILDDEKLLALDKFLALSKSL